MTEIIQPVKVKVGGLWKNETKTGLTFFSGDLSYNTRIEIWPNKFKKTAKDPDFNLFISEKIKKEGHPLPQPDIAEFPPNNVPF